MVLELCVMESLGINSALEHIIAT